MRRRIAVMIAACAVACAAAVFAERPDPTREGERRCESCYRMHPEFRTVDGYGRGALGAAISSNATCGACHDAAFINRHNTHYTDAVKADCAECHFAGGRLGFERAAAAGGGMLRTGAIRLQPPRGENCGRCHGVVHEGTAPLAVPDDYGTRSRYDGRGAHYGITQNTGAILSGQYLSQSHLNLKGKSGLNIPWDNHAQRGVACSSCHYAANDPRRCAVIRSDIDYLKTDPRKVQSLGKYLHRPDHQLVASTCTSCHNPYAAHKRLPFKKKHFTALDCQSCHVPRVYGPAYAAVDETVVRANGAPRVEYRGMDPTDESPVNARYAQGYVPYLFTRPSSKAGDVVSPYNLVTTWYWRSADGKRVPAELVRRAFLDKGTYRSPVIALLDANHDKTLHTTELVLDTPEKVAAIRRNLEELGVRGPEIAGEIAAHRINHGIVSGKSMTLDCAFCHSDRSSLAHDVLLTRYSPDGALPRLVGDAPPRINGYVSREDDGRVIVDRRRQTEGRYIFGFSRLWWIDTLGFTVFMVVAFGVGVHALLRYYTTRYHPTPLEKTTRLFVYTFYERVWHWVMAVSVIILAVTGLEIHYAGSTGLLGFANAVSVHNALALVVVANAGLSLFYHLATGRIRQFFSVDRSFGTMVLAQASYYLYGIFNQWPHPVEKTPDRTMNPLQQAAYVFLLNVLFPLQIITGVLMWLSGLTVIGPDALTVIAPLHSLGSWFFISFLLVHVYLTTTGRRITSYLEGMITGYEEVDERTHAGELRTVTRREIVDTMKHIFRRHREEADHER